MAIAKVINISITGLWFRNLICLNIKEVRDPKIIPIPTDTNPSKKNCPMIIKGVAAVMSELITLSTAPKRMIDTLSLKIPSPKMQLKSLG
jgi:hypothetical protein